jgi:hypothetical protein
LDHEDRRTVAVVASIAHPGPAGTDDARPDTGDDALFERALRHAKNVIAWSRSDEVRGLAHEAREERLLTDALEFARLCLQGQLDLEAAREQSRNDVVDADGVVRRTTETGQRHDRITIVGTVTTSRIAYRGWRRENLYPRDATLGWAGGHSYSAGVERRVAQAAATVPFAQAAAQVSAAGAIRLGKRQAEQLAIGAAIDFERFYAARRPAPCPPDVGLLLTFDGSAFPVLPDALRPPTAKAAAARAKVREQTGRPEDPADLRRASKRTAQLAAVADIPPAPRQPADILTCLFGPARGTRASSSSPAPGPQAHGRTLFASAERPAADVIAAAFAEADRRDPDQSRPWFVLVDGNCHQIDTALALAAARGKPVTILIDLIHVVQYLWKAADCFFYKGDPAARAWVVEQTGKLLHGRHRDVRIGIRRRATRFDYGPTERAGADECARYLENKKDHLDYPAFLAAGWPIASGLIEGAARWMIKDRLEVTGARWSLTGAEAVLRLRALVGNGDFDDFAYHLRQQRHRDHHSRYQQPVYNLAA